MNHAMEAIGWTLIHFCWQAAVIALLYRLADAVLSRSRSHVRYAVALAALLAMLAAASATLIYEAAGSSHERAGYIASRDNEPVTTVHRSAIVAATDVPSAALPDPGVPILAAFHDAVQTRLRGAMPWLDAMWLLGVLCLSARTIGGWVLIQRLRRSSLVSVPAHVRVAFDGMARRMGIERRIDLRISARISGPLAMGMLKSVVLLPASALTALSPEQLEVVLAHELAHIRRADYLWNMVQTMIETLFFFHPAVWWVSGDLRRQRELCCDDAALECCADPVTYATALLRLEEERGSRLHLAMALDGHESCGLRARIARILGETPEGGRDVAPFSLIGAGGMLLVLLVAAPRLFADLYVDVPAKAQNTAPALASTLALPVEPKIAGDPNTDAAPAPKGSAPAPAAKPAAPTSVLAPASAPAPLSVPVPVSVPASAPVPAPAARPSAATPQAELSQVTVIVPPAPETAPTLASLPMVLAALPKEVCTERCAPNAKTKVKFAIASSVAVMVTDATSAAQESNSAQATGSSKGDYIDEMRAAGYNVDLDKYVAMKIQGVTPEYARRMASTGFGKPTADDLIAMKIHGVDPGEVAELKAAGIDATSYQDLIKYRIFNVTPEYVAGMKAAGFANLDTKKLVEMRIQGVTPEFAKTTKQQWPDATVNQLVQLRIFDINQAFIASAKRHGLEPLTIDKLVKLKISGILDDENPSAEKSK
jgi:beta-lactamase regulating signal transducer with metallopeptidase domain